MNTKKCTFSSQFNSKTNRVNKNFYIKSNKNFLKKLTKKLFRPSKFS